MTSALALQRLLVWASPAFPVGSFGYSAGLETAIARGQARSRESVQEWIGGNLESGAARNDAILAAEAHRRHEDVAGLAELADLCLALTPARERYMEVRAVGDAFLAAARAWPNPVHDRLPECCPYPVALGAAVGAAGISLGDMLVAFLTSYAQAQVSVAVRLVPLGQSEGVKILAALELLIARLAGELAATGLDDLGSAGFACDIAAMAHETLETRIFRS